MKHVRRVNLVLGAGGAAGWVFHAGVVQALRATLEWDASDAHLLVGTSAGSAVAAAIRAGVQPEDVIHMVRNGPSEEERAAYIAKLRDTPRSFRPVAPGLARRIFRPGELAVAAAGLLPSGIFPTDPLGDFPGVRSHTSWPSGLWIPSIRAHDGTVVVFGRDRTDVAVRDAIEASSAVPGLFRPKDIAGDLYLDGGLASSTHAHLARTGKPDVVIISAPLTRPGTRPLSVMARRTLMHERAELVDAGIHTVTIAPPQSARELFRGFPRRDRSAAAEIAQLASATTREMVAAARLHRVFA